MLESVTLSLHPSAAELPSVQGELLDAFWRAADSITTTFPGLTLALSFDPRGPKVEGRSPAASVDIDLSCYGGVNVDIYALDADVRRAANRGACHLFLFANVAETDLCLPVLTRYQRYLPSPLSTLEERSLLPILRAHERLHDLGKPLHLADYEHAIDTWRWVLRLDPGASFACQIAALFHDVERLTAEPDVRVEHHAKDYAAFKEAHAAHGADIAHALLVDAGVPRSLADDVRDLVASHERPGAHREGALLAEADALSFFSLNSPGFLDYYGEEHTMKKIAYSLGRMRCASRRRVAGLWLRRDVRRLLETVGTN